MVQEALLEISQRLGEYVEAPGVPFYLWLRHITGLKLLEMHRRHLGTQMRDADREIPIHRNSFQPIDCDSLADQLLANLTSPSQAAMKSEARLRLQEALAGMDELDREVLTLKHFEQLSLSEIAEIVGLSRAGAGSRYLRAVKRLREILEAFPGFGEW